ncbi:MULTISPECIES: molybdopterin-dependent oxidoreductase [unclassified Dyella]|uniref:SorA family sulfite dehydrogenase catalytic subunit n=1 Tax=unclassified Dyella TaxID=2634549 RepID=UPI000C866C15|nr:MULTISPECIES: molybdopterin-dependent oxidoreductase [unclassified Dyella]MDR3447004.1 molybdopterin-dependent oxidoreductase [Dyella sp.]PMQ05855.1 Sulfoxide reductase catalytic subunit YedY [Dyella sp. AD56]
MNQKWNANDPSRRRFLRAAGWMGSIGALGGAKALAADAPTAQLPFANGQRELTRAFPQKGEMLLLRTRPPMLETPFDVFDQGVFTPNNRFFVRWHLAYIPTQIDAESFRLNVHGQVDKPLTLSLKQLMSEFETVEIAAVNQCSGNSRGLFHPRIAGGQWANGAMGCARWTGVRLKDILDKAGVNADAVQVRFKGLDSGVLPATPDFLKSLDIDHARDGEVMVAWGMNDEQLPLLNGFPLRLIVPGWYSTYWVKMLSDIEVLDKPDTNFWMAKAYLIPDTPHAAVVPGQTGYKSVPINRMVPRSFITNLRDGDKVLAGHATQVRGIAFGGDAGIAKVLWSADGGAHWEESTLEQDHGKYSFRRWHAKYTPSAKGENTLMVKAVNTNGVEQPAEANWNPGGFMRNVIESVKVRVG